MPRYAQAGWFAEVGPLFFLVGEFDGGTVFSEGDELRERVWDRYGEHITEQMRFEYEQQQVHAQLELFPFNDEIPF